MPALPAHEKSLWAFVAWLANENLKHHTIKVYLSAVHHMQVAAPCQALSVGYQWPRLQYVLQGD